MIDALFDLLLQITEYDSALDMGDGDIDEAGGAISSPRRRGWLDDYVLRQIELLKAIHATSRESDYSQ